MGPFLLDTNVLSETMRRQPNPQVQAWVAGLPEIHLSVVTVEEITFGLRRKGLLEKEAWFRRFLGSGVKVHEIDDALAQWAGGERGKLSAQGRVTTQADGLIAATAWRHGLVLATRNTRDFEGFGLVFYNPFGGSQG